MGEASMGKKQGSVHDCKYPELGEGTFVRGGVAKVGEERGDLHHDVGTATESHASNE